MKRAAIYARVSTTDRKQDPETQLRQLREYAERRGFPVVREYVDQASGAKSEREQFRAMLADAKRREFDVLLVWRYDRFARSLRELVNALAEFEGLGIEFISYCEGADTTTPQGRLLFGIMGSLAEFERTLIAERVRAGMARAKAQGKHVGRPALPAAKRRQIERLLAQGELSKRAIARAVGVSVQTVVNRAAGRSDHASSPLSARYPRASSVAENLPATEGAEFSDICVHIREQDRFVE